MAQSIRREYPFRLAFLFFLPRRVLDVIIIITTIDFPLYKDIKLYNLRWDVWSWEVSRWDSLFRNYDSTLLFFFTRARKKDVIFQIIFFIFLYLLFNILNKNKHFIYCSY